MIDVRGFAFFIKIVGLMMKRLLLALMMFVSVPLGAADKTILTTEQVAKVASLTHSGFRQTEDVYTNGARRNGDMNFIFEMEKVCYEALRKDKSERLLATCFVEVQTGVMIAIAYLNTPSSSVRNFRPYIPENAYARFKKEAEANGFSKEAISNVVSQKNMTDGIILGLIDSGMPI